MVGPVCAKLALYLSGSYSNKLEDITDVKTVTSEGRKMSEVDVLISRINAIRKDIKERDEKTDEAEAAFNEAAEEQNLYSEEQMRHNRRGFIRK